MNICVYIYHICLVQVGGTSMDFYCDEGIPYSFDIELPDLGELGMLLSPSDILEVIRLFKQN